jgi:hypothetical protein
MPGADDMSEYMLAPSHDPGHIQSKTKEENAIEVSTYRTVLGLRGCISTAGRCVTYHQYQTLEK